MYKTIALMECSDCKEHFEEGIDTTFEPEDLENTRYTTMTVCPECLTTMMPTIIVTEL